MTSAKSAAARLSVLSNTTLVAMKVIVGIMTGSVSIIAEALHSGLDLVAAAIAWVAVRAADAPPDEEHPYGHGKVENLSGGRGDAHPLHGRLDRLGGAPAFGGPSACSCG